MPQDKLPIKDFAAKIKAKYPQYASVADDVLVQKIVAKYPEYEAQVDLSPLKKKEGQPSPAPGKPVSAGGPQNSPSTSTSTSPSGLPLFGAPKAKPTDKIGQQVQKNEEKRRAESFDDVEASFKEVMELQRSVSTETDTKMAIPYATATSMDAVRGMKERDRANLQLAQQRKDALLKEKGDVLFAPVRELLESGKAKDFFDASGNFKTGKAIEYFSGVVGEKGGGTFTRQLLVNTLRREGATLSQEQKADLKKNTDAGVKSVAGRVGLAKKSMVAGWYQTLANYGHKMASEGIDNALSRYLQSKDYDAQQWAPGQYEWNGKEWIDRAITSGGQSIGGSLPSLIPSTIATVATGGLAGTVIGAGIGYTGEKASITGSIYDQVLQQTGDPALARKKADEVGHALEITAPAYLLSSAATLKTFKPGSIGAKALGFGLEAAEEYPVEFYQGWQEAKATQGYKGSLTDYVQENPETALDILVATTGQSTGIAVAGKILRTLNAKTPAARNQLYADIVSKHGVDFGLAVIDQHYQSGELSEEGFAKEKAELLQTAEQLKAFEGLGIKGEDAKAYVAVSKQVQDLKGKLGATEDPTLRSALEIKIKQAEKNLNDIVGGKGAYAVITYPGGAGQTAVIPLTDLQGMERSGEIDELVRAADQIEIVGDEALNEQYQERKKVLGTPEAPEGFYSKPSVILPSDNKRSGEIHTVAPKKEEPSKTAPSVIRPAQNKPAPVTTIAPKQVEAEPKGDTRPSVILPSANKGAQVVEVKRGETQVPHAESVKQQFREQFSKKGVREEEIEGAIALMDARANSWASEQEGRTPEQWYDKIAGVKGGEFQSGTQKQFQIVGEKAVLPEEAKANLLSARDMEAGGKDAKTIFLATGWEKGADGKWRYEIPDGGVTDNFSKATRYGNRAEVGEVYEGAILDAHPELKGYTVEYAEGNGWGGSFNPKTKHITISYPEVRDQLGNVDHKATATNRADVQKAESILLHELQHAVQSLEGFARGASPSEFKVGGRIFDDNSQAVQTYKRVAGEAEARNVQTRSGMDSETKKQTPLSETEDVARDEQILRFDNATMAQEEGTRKLYSEKRWNWRTQQEEEKVMTVYHGTGENFKGYSKEKSSGTTRYGRGISFTDGRGIAMRYSIARQGLEDATENDHKAIIKEAQLLIAKPFDEREGVDTSTPEAKKLITLLNERYGTDSQLAENILKGNTKDSPFVGISKIIFDKKADDKTFLFHGDTEKTRRLLEDAGYDSIIGSYEEANEYFVFDEKDIADNIQYQKDGVETKGAVETLADGRVIIHALTSPDFSTLVHEIAHVFEKDLTDAERRVIEKAGGSEAFARGFERYVRDGKAPNKELQPLFDKFKQWLTHIYKTLKGSPIEKKVSPEVKAIFDRLLTDVSPQSATPTPLERVSEGERGEMGPVNIQDIGEGFEIHRGVMNGKGKGATQGFYSYDKEGALGYANGEESGVTTAVIKPGAKVLRLVDGTTDNYDTNDTDLQTFVKIIGKKAYEGTYSPDDPTDITEVLWGNEETVAKLRKKGIDVVVGNSMDGVAVFVVNPEAISEKGSAVSPSKKEEFREAILTALESANGSEFSEVISDISLQDSDRKTAVKNIRKGKSTVATKKVEAAIEKMWADGYVYLNRGRGDHAESYQMPIAEFLDRLTQNDEAFQDLSRQAQNLQASLDALGEDLFSDTVEEVVEEVRGEMQAEIEEATKQLQDAVDAKRVKKYVLDDIIEAHGLSNPEVNGFEETLGEGWKEGAKKGAATKEQLQRLQDAYVRNNKEHIIASAYHKAKTEGTNPALVSEVEAIINHQSPQSNELKTPSTPSQDTNTPEAPATGSNEANRTTGSPAGPAQSKSGKYEAKARKLADKIKKSDLPSWMSIQDPSVKKQGLSADDLKAALAEAVIKVGQLLDMGVDAKVAVNRGVDDIVRLYKEELAKVKGKLKPEAEAAIRRGAEDEIRKDLGLPPAGSVVLSHKGLQEVADEFGLADVQRRERKSDAELLQEAEETMQDWKDRGVYAREVEHLVSLAESARVLTDTERVILEQHLANLIGEARGLRASDPSAYDEALVEIRRVKRAGEITRSAAGAALRIPSNAGSVPRTIEDAMVDRMEAAGVDVLTEAQKADVEAKFAAMQAALAEEKRLREAAEAANARLQAEAEILAARKTRPAPQPKAAKQKDFKKERDGIKAAIKEKLRKSRGQMNSAGQAMIDFVSIAPDVARLMKSYVEEGVVTLAEIIQKIHADVKEVEPSITEDDIRDIIAGKYNEPRPTKSDLLRQMQDLRTEAKLLAKLADLESGAVPQNPRRQVVRNQRIKELRDQIEALQKSSGLGRYSPSAKEQAAIEAAKESIHEMERKLRENDLSIEQHKGPDTPALRALRDKQKDLRKQIDAKRKEAGLGKWAGDYQLRKIKERNEAKLREVQAKLKAGDFYTKPRPKPAIENPEFKAKYPELYQQTLDAIAAKEKAQHELNLANAREAMALRPGIEKVMGKFGKALRTLKATMAGIDMSALGVQNLPAILSNPYVGFKAFKGSLTDMGSAAHFERELARIHASEWWPLIEQSGLSIIDPKSLRQAEHNDLFNNTFYDDLNITRNGRKVNIAPTKPFERQFTSLGNYIRINLFLRRAEKLLEQGKTFENSPESFKTVASIVNNMTGRGSGGEWFEKNRQALSTIFWSPGLMSSSFNLLGISDVALLFVGKKGFYGKILTSDQKLWAAGQIGRAISTGIVIMLAIAWSDDEAEIDWDPTSVTFGYVKSGDYSWSIFGRFTKPVRYIVMRLTGIKNTPKGEVELDDNPYGATMGEELYRGVSGYFNPVFGTGVNIAKGTDFSGQPTNVANELGKMLYPMSFGEFYKGYQADGVGGVLKKGVPSFAGIRVTHRKDFYHPLQAPKKLRHNGADVDLPEGLQKQFTRELQASEAAKLPVLQATDAYRAATPQQRLEMEAWLRKTVKAEEQKRLKDSHPDLFPELSEEEEEERAALKEQQADLRYLLFGEDE